jgi:hypothetical protein
MQRCSGTPSARLLCWQRSAALLRCASGRRQRQRPPAPQSGGGNVRRIVTRSQPVAETRSCLWHEAAPKHLLLAAGGIASSCRHGRQRACSGLGGASAAVSDAIRRRGNLVCADGASAAWHLAVLRCIAACSREAQARRQQAWCCSI